MEPAKILMPRSPAPKNNRELLSEFQRGIDLDEMIHLEIHPRKEAETSMRNRFEMMIQFASWEMLLRGELTVSRPDEEPRQFGVGGLRTTDDLMDVRRAVLEAHGRSIVALNTATMREHMRFFNELRNEGQAEVCPCDHGYMNGSEMVKFVENGKVLAVSGTQKVGRILKTKLKFNLEQREAGEYLRGTQRFLPELLAPHRILLAEGI